MGVLQNALQQGLNRLNKTVTDVSWTIEAGSPKKGTDVLELRPNDRIAAFRGTAAQLSFAYILDVAMVIDELSYANSTYDNIVRQRAFGQLYQLGQRALSYVDGVTFTNKTVETIPCQICGLVLPLSHITIDHVRPQTGGAVESVAKMMRVLQLTVAGPTGAKAQSLQAAVGTALSSPGGLAQGLYRFQMQGNLPPVPTKPGRAPKGPQATSLVDRYSLNWQGALFYSTVISLDCGKELDNRCMHSLVNLRPLCGPCNASRGNPLKFV